VLVLFWTGEIYPAEVKAATMDATTFDKSVPVVVPVTVVFVEKSVETNCCPIGEALTRLASSNICLACCIHTDAAEAHDFMSEYRAASGG